MKINNKKVLSLTCLVGTVTGLALSYGMGNKEANASPTNRRTINSTSSSTPTSSPLRRSLSTPNIMVTNSDIKNLGNGGKLVETKSQPNLNTQHTNSAGEFGLREGSAYNHPLVKNGWASPGTLPNSANVLSVTREGGPELISVKYKDRVTGTYGLVTYYNKDNVGNWHPVQDSSYDYS